MVGYVVPELKKWRSETTKIRRTIQAQGKYRKYREVVKASICRLAVAGNIV